MLNGGLVRAGHLLNLRVDGSTCGGDIAYVPPEETLATLSRAMGGTGTVVGMMTAAFMNSCRYATERADGVEVTALVTSSLSNARLAGDAADWRSFDEPEYAPGTISILVATNAHLTQACMAKALMLAAEAKAATRQDLDAKSPVSGKIATGTGTDSTAVVSGPGPVTLRYCGKHILFGEMLARAVSRALRQTIRSWP